MISVEEQKAEQIEEDDRDREDSKYSECVNVYNQVKKIKKLMLRNTELIGEKNRANNSDRLGIEKIQIENSDNMRLAKTKLWTMI